MNLSLRTIVTTLAAAGLLLSAAGCTNSADPAPISETSTSVQVPITAPGSESNSPVASSTPTELGYLDSAALKTAVQRWADGTKGTVVSDEDALRKQLPAAQKWLEGITVVPDSCGLYGLGNLKEQLDKSAVAAAVLPQASGGEVTVASYADRGALVADVAAQQHLDESCGTFAITGAGQKVTYKLTRVEATSSAPYTAATMLESANGDNKSRQISVRAIDGNVMMIATRTVQDTPEAAAALALDDVESLLKILRSAPPETALAQ